MARSSQPQLAVLGALSVEPMTGYALRQAITETLGHFWRESFGQIYPALATLEAEGAVRRTEPGRTSGSRFELTEAGSARLRELLAEPFEPAPRRDGLLLRLFFGRQLGVPACRDLLEGARDDAEAAVQHYARLRAEVEAEIATDEAVSVPDAPFWLLTIAAGQHTAAAQLAWATEALAMLDQV